MFMDDDNMSNTPSDDDIKEEGMEGMESGEESSENTEEEV